ncbi:hypothetical protein EPUS_09220 [Endocarpon pusillum Z07020]|uniref:Uncharacterized protein n=1 Tax=Endocarpon pusillum (strain Z07020 / HMAS-L-300199) TaxID=1263415 RepID=U1GEF9_ENDPU|nr:uncharacterized protein EPUS_09220 [Endocarpon pusillum Z07020]ERF70478.1 hypothetical protein EPUS_09220 [Endocarpon pusillum Z07020]
MFASGHLDSLLPVPIDGKLELVGVKLGTIRGLQQTPLGKPTTDSEMAGLAHSILSMELLKFDYVAGGTVLEAYVRTMCLEAFAENFSPPLEHIPGLDSSIVAVDQILSPKAGNQHTTDGLSRFLSKWFRKGKGMGLSPASSGAGRFLTLGPATRQKWTLG